MNVIEAYSLTCGTKISKPYIYTSFFPVPFEKYITFHSDCIGNARNYDYIQDVINIINPVLIKQGIRIVQVGDTQERTYNNCISVKGQCNINQFAYVIQNSLLHFGPDSFPIHLAAGFDIPLVALFSTNYIECSGPYFGSKEKQICIASYDKLGVKPSFSNEENPKTINLIKPEEIAASIFKLLGIDFNIPFESIWFGKKYSSYSIQESYPNSNHIVFNPEGQVEIRADKDCNEESLFHQLSQYKKSILIMDKPVNINVLKQLKPHILMIAFKITDIDHTKFLKELETIGSKIVMISELSQEEINKLKIKYYQFGLINRIEYTAQEKIDELRKDTSKLYYRSAKVTSSKGKFYYSSSAIEKEIPLGNHYEYQKVIDEPEFWKNLDFFHIIKEKGSHLI